MEAGLHDNQASKSSRNLGETKLSEEVEDGDSKTLNREEVVVDINGGDNGGSRSSTESSKGEKVCRICHFGKEDSSDASELIPLGCDCRGELGVSHNSCAEVWFSQKGNRLCEICGKMAKNIIRNNNEEENSIFMMEWNEMRIAAETLEASYHHSSRCCTKSFCNLLLGCLVLAFVLSWFLRWTNIF